MTTVQMPNNLKNLRTNRGYSSAREFADQVEIPYNTYIRYERGDRIPVDKVKLLAEALHCSIDDIFETVSDYDGQLIGGPERKSWIEEAYESLPSHLQHLADSYMHYLLYQAEVESCDIYNPFNEKVG